MSTNATLGVSTASIRFLGKSTTVNGSDYLAVYNGTVLMAFLKPSAAIQLPIYSSSSWSTPIDSQQIQVASKSASDIDIYGSNNIAVEYLMFENYV